MHENLLNIIKSVLLSALMVFVIIGTVSAYNNGKMDEVISVASVDTTVEVSGEILLEPKDESSKFTNFKESNVLDDNSEILESNDKNKFKSSPTNSSILKATLKPTIRPTKKSTNKQKIKPTSKYTSTPKVVFENKSIFKGSKVKARGLYLTGWVAGSEKRRKHFIELANKTEINAYVVDIKDQDGKVAYKSDIPEVIKIGAYTKKYNVDKVVKELHENNIYIIGRLVCFKDPILSSKRPELGIKSIKGGLWKDKKGKTYLNPYKKDSWKYLIDIAKEASKKGFDEIQFDYVRFANGGKNSTMDFRKYDKKKYKVINEFLAYAKKELPGVVISANVFGVICERPGDTEHIGQNLDSIGLNIEYISPMLYPSHYGFGQTINKVKFPKPDLNPYGVIFNTLKKTKVRIAAIPKYKANVRPYIQNFTASWLGKGNYKRYEEKEVKAQIKAVYDAGYDQWLVWSPKNKYSEAAFKKKK